MEVAAECVPGIWRNVGHQHQCQEGKERFGILQGFLPQGPGEVGKSCTRTWEPTSWRAQSRAKGGRGVMMMGCLYMGEGHH